MVYKAEVSSGSLLTMTTQERLACYFASPGVFTNEHFESLNEKPLMQARLKSGLVSAVPASQIVGSIKALVSMLETQIVSDNVVLFGVSANYMKQYCGSNVKGQSISEWKATAVWNVTPEKADEEVEEDEMMLALREMESGGGIDAFEMARTPLEFWCRSWMGSNFSRPLEPVEWFHKGHQPGVHLWAPPPAVALIGLKQLAKSRQK